MTGRLFVCDSYQKTMLEIVRETHADRSSLYDFEMKKIYSVERFEKVPMKLQAYMRDKGFCMLIRQGDKFKPYLDAYNDQRIIIYSMWRGYLNGKAANPSLAAFLNSYPLTYLHTSGHATADSLAEIINVVNPKVGVIPMHTEHPETFAHLIDTSRLILLNDGDTLET